MQLISRRGVLAGGLAAIGGEAFGQSGARRRVYPAGAPAALLVWAVTPGALLGWPRPLSRAQLAFLPASAGGLPTLGMLTAGGPAANLEGVAALRPDLVLDYGDLGPGYAALASRARLRLRRPYALIDGRLAATPAALRETARLMEAPARGARLADAAADILGDWSAARRSGGRTFYYARGPDGLETGRTGSLATEVLEGAGWRNVASAGQGLARVNLEQVLAWDPEVVVTVDGGWAQRAAADPRWSRRRSGRRRSIVAVADAPFGWLDRPPSINRLLGCAWAASADPLSPQADRALLRRAADFHALFYGRRPSAAQLAELSPRVFA